ncbi:uncharacterized protein TNCV_3425431 [Trichonephila clavipes]|nr:uncharacterized protein TNCV_3425431 [Trichonephila clavipes]
MSASLVLLKTRRAEASRCTSNMSRLKRPRIGEMWKLEGVQPQVSSSSHDHGSELREKSRRCQLEIQKCQDLKNSSEKKISSVEEKIALKVGEKVGAVKKKMEEKIEKIKEQVVERIEEMSQKIEDLEKKLLACGNKNESKFVPASPIPVPASPVGEAAEVLQTLPDKERLNLNSLYNGLDLRFGQKYSKEYARLQMKTIHQKTGKSLQEYASEIERLANLAFSDYPANVQEIISLQYFVDGLKDGEIQRAIRMADVQDLKSALKLEATTQASCTDRHSIRGARMTADASWESPWKMEIKKLKQEI